MEKGWDARGLLRPLWHEIGGRDALAEASGIAGQTLSAYNSGSRQLGIANARKIVEGLTSRGVAVTVLELGAPLEAVDDLGLGFLDRLQALAATVDDLQTANDGLRQRIEVLERDAAAQRSERGEAKGTRRGRPTQT